MSAAFDQPSRSWWNTVKGQNPRYSSEKPKLKSSLNSLASALGIKPKKSPTLQIEDPPFPIQSPPPVDPLPHLPNRPPSKSVSSTFSRADSAGPRTPSDIHHHNPARQSLLTLSDPDPFAGRGVVTISSPTDPTRLSAYSNGSVNDFSQTKGVEFPHDRVSYASSSSLSQSHSNANPGEQVLRTLSPISPSEAYINKGIMKKSSQTYIGRASSYDPPPLHKVSSSTTLIASGPRPAMRPRGMTDNGAMHKSGFFVDSESKPTAGPSKPPPKPPPSASKPISPRVIIRQASLQHLNPPSAPPPRQGLPATPVSPGSSISVTSDHRTDGDSSRLAPTTASSTISFASSTSSRDLYPTSPLVPPERPRRISERSFFASALPGMEKLVRPSSSDRANAARAPLSPQASLKKVLSHQSLRKRGQLFSSSSSSQTQTQPSTPLAPSEPKKSPQKQSSHFPRMPVPPVPLAVRRSNSSQPIPTDVVASPVEQSRPSTSSHSGGRKRLFSGGSSLRRPSTSHSPSNPGDDDSQSIFSVKSEQEMYISTAFFKPWSTQSTSSFWDEGNSEGFLSNPSRVASEFGVQQQSSPASTLGRSELNNPRQRGLSVRSNETTHSNYEPDIPSSPRSGSDPQRRLQRSNTLLLRGKLEVAKPSPSTIKTATEKKQPFQYPTVAVPDPIERSYNPATPPPSMITSLPPPPRRNRAVVIAQPEPEPPAVVSLPPPPNRPPRPKPVVTIEKGIHRRSIMKKPSFLEIDDDSDQEDEVVVETIIGNSFLDFARESFDTVRSTY